MKYLVQLSQHALAKGWLPDGMIRWGIRRLLDSKLRDEQKIWDRQGRERIRSLIRSLEDAPIAVNTREANQQHYEVPTEFFRLVMGRHMKYSSCLWTQQTSSLDEAEEAMLELTCERADLSDGQSILELGCGWGSLTMFMARKYPDSRVMAVSNSRTQKQYIDQQCRLRGLSNVSVVTADMNDFWTDETFDRVVSVEMFEHMRNHRKLLKKISSFLRDDGRLFVHIFTHQRFAYLYDETDASDWIARYFFTGGIMPSDDFFDYFRDCFHVEEHWRVSGEHYQKTAEAWLKNMDRQMDRILPIFRDVYGAEAGKWVVYWRVFFMSCAELWGFRRGTEWIVSHYRMKKAGRSSGGRADSHRHLLLGL